MATTHKRIKATTVQWTPDGGAPVTLSLVDSVDFEKTGDTSPILDDGSIYTVEIALHGITGNVTITTRNQDHADIALGGGALQMDLEPPKTGTGTAGQAKRVTFPNALLVTNAGSASSTPGGTQILTFQAASDGSGNIYTYEDAV